MAGPPLRRVLRRWLLGATVAIACLPAAAHAGDFVGVYADDAFFGSPAYRSIAFQAQSQLGSGLVRQPFDWRRIETQPDQYDFAGYDDFVLRAASAGLQVLPVLGNPPSFRALTSTSDASWSPPRDNAEFAAFAIRLVQRYGPGGTLWSAHPEVPAVPIRSWQIWNEPNLAMFWRSGPDPAAYTALLRAAGAAIHAVDPSAEVVAAGLPDSSLGIPLETYLNGMFAAGAHGAFDTLAVHPYAEAPDDVLRLVTLTRLIMAANGDESPLWITEVGWATGGPSGPRTTSEAGQAARLGELLDDAWARRDALGLRGVVIFRWRDAVSSFDAWPLHAGLLRADASAKPSLASVGDAIARMHPEIAQLPDGGALSTGGLEATGEQAATDGAAGGESAFLPARVSAPRKPRIAIRGAELSRFGFVRVHLACLTGACAGKLAAGTGRGACTGSRRFALRAGKAVVVRLALRRATGGAARCRHTLVRASTGDGDPPAAAYVSVRPIRR